MRHGHCLRRTAPLARLSRHLSARSDEERREKLEDWADVKTLQSELGVESAKISLPSGPKGYPGLRRTNQKKAQKWLVFLLDDRALCRLVVVCKRWFQKEMAKYLLDYTVFQDTELPCTDVVQIAADFNTKWGFPTE